MWNIHDYDVRNGETKRVNCPVCRGHKTFTITNQMGSLVWNCYKASCDVSGGKRVSLSVTDIKNSFKEQERNSFLTKIDGNQPDASSRQKNALGRAMLV